MNETIRKIGEREGQLMPRNRLSSSIPRPMPKMGTALLYENAV